jgi:hypothetical protein
MNTPMIEAEQTWTNTMDEYLRESYGRVVLADMVNLLGIPKEDIIKRATKGLKLDRRGDLNFKLDEINQLTYMVGEGWSMQTICEEMPTKPICGIYREIENLKGLSLELSKPRGRKPKAKAPYSKAEMDTLIYAVNNGIKPRSKEFLEKHYHIFDGRSIDGIDFKYYTLRKSMGLGKPTKEVVESVHSVHKCACEAKQFKQVPDALKAVLSMLNKSILDLDNYPDLLSSNTLRLDWNGYLISLNITKNK